MRLPLRLPLVLAVLLASGCGGDASGDGSWGVEKGTYGDKEAAGDTPTASGEAPGEDGAQEAPDAPEAGEDAPLVSAPEEAPVVAPPPPSGDIVDRDDHVDFALDFLGRQAFNSVPGLMDLYGERVRYFDRGTVSRATVATDKGNYFERWPNRYYEIAGPVRATRGANPTIRFDYVYAVSDATASGEREGRAWVELGLSPASGGYVITSERGGNY